jgi:hypothetical protein
MAFPVDLIRRSPLPAVTRGLDREFILLRIDFANGMDVAAHTPSA